MRQRRLLELIKDYDCIIYYHPGKVNVVTNALSRKTVGLLVVLRTTQARLVKEFEKLKLQVVIPPASVTVRIATLKIQSTLKDRIKNAQDNDPF